jgi:hypothetical protein
VTHYTLGDFRKATAEMPDELPIIVRSVSGEFEYTDPATVTRTLLDWFGDQDESEPDRLDCVIIDQQ